MKRFYWNLKSTTSFDLKEELFFCNKLKLYTGIDKLEIRLRLKLFFILLFQWNKDVVGQALIIQRACGQGNEFGEISLCLLFYHHYFFPKEDGIHAIYPIINNILIVNTITEVMHTITLVQHLNATKQRARCNEFNRIISQFIIGYDSHNIIMNKERVRRND